MAMCFSSKVGKGSSKKGEPERSLLKKRIGPVHPLENEVGPFKIEIGEIAERGLRGRDQDHDQKDGRGDRRLATRKSSI